MQRRRGSNPKRRIKPFNHDDSDRFADLAFRAVYTGNPEHKRAPADYGLTPPASPRPGKTLCDGERQIAKEEAQELLTLGMRKGLVSVRERDGWPQNVWAISSSGEVFEAQLENSTMGTYHGYPLTQDDDFREFVKREWSGR